MIKNYIKVALRNVARQKFFAFINITGLAVGISCCLLILTYVMEELSYDNFHPDVESTYRVALDRKFPDNQFIYARSPMPMGRTLVRDLSTVKSSTRIFNQFGTLTFQIGDKFFDERNVLAVDSTFFAFFAVDFIEGDKTTALDLPNSLIITEAMATKYFGTEDPLGKQLTIQNVGEMLVRGVVKPMPSNTHFHFDFLFSLSSMPGLYRNEFWGSYNAHNYIKLEKGTGPTLVESQIEEVIKTYMEPQIQNILGISWAQYEAAGNDHNYFLQPVSDIHLKSNHQWELEANGNETIVYLFAAISFFILLIACINFINLTTARAANRAREVGMRKVLGALKKQLVVQFLTESVFMCLFATVVAMILAILLVPYFNDISGKALNVQGLLEPIFIVGLVVFSIILGVVSGLYPAFFLSAFKPVAVLKGKMSSGAKNSWLRNGLVVFQFGISIILVIGTLVIYQQIQFLNDKPLGFDKDQLIIIERADLLGEQAETFKNILLDNPQVLEVSGTNTVPGRQINGGTFTDVTGNASDRYLMPNIRGDYDLIETMGFEVVEGRAFDPAIVSDSSAIIVNESAVRTFGWQDPIGKQLQPINGPISTVIGVVKDFHFESLHQPIGPVALFASDIRVGRPNIFLAKVSTQNLASTLARVESSWDDFVQQRPFDVAFVDQEFGQLYDAEERSGRLFTAFSVLAIVIACLGAFGLAAFLATQRSKEIGVRKVLGASTSSIVGLLSKEFVKLILVANLIAWPVAFFLMRQWLETFAYAIGINLMVFVLATLASLFIALSTVSFHSIRAALKNPAETLHQE
ncbi:ABC transporter permease [Roseivirga sp. E12]|uniref:ABC transporter permease n=1 Tax=Roseivirga sp. E12 TaxID=2819237 RepID=UPI001ABD0A44|nr:ABC transporter permease [Roseivirga sp. E12]MBO3698296.1 ABC transporter permease [Roseivirga sp. E12]